MAYKVFDVLLANLLDVLDRFNHELLAATSRMRFSLTSDCLFNHMIQQRPNN